MTTYQKYKLIVRDGLGIILLFMVSSNFSNGRYNLNEQSWTILDT